MAQGQLSLTPRDLFATVGDDWGHKVTLWEDGIVKNVSTATAITVALQDHGGNEVISDTASLSGTTGAAWATGVIVLPFTSTQTANLFSNEYLVEIQVTIGGLKITWPLLTVTVQNSVIA